MRRAKIRLGRTGFSSAFAKASAGRQFFRSAFSGTLGFAQFGGKFFFKTPYLLGMIANIVLIIVYVTTAIAGEFIICFSE
jgi:hypothetical protein